MKKHRILLLITACFCFVKGDAQKTATNPCDSIQMFYDQALVVLDSVIGNQNQLQKQLEKTRAELATSRAETRKVVKDKTDTSSGLREARKLISDQLKRIDQLEAEVKRLSSLKKEHREI